MLRWQALLLLCVVAAHCAPLCQQNPVVGGRWIDAKTWTFNEGNTCRHRAYQPSEVQTLLAKRWVHLVGDSTMFRLFLAFVNMLGGESDPAKWEQHKDQTFSADGAKITFHWRPYIEDAMFEVATFMQHNKPDVTLFAVGLHDLLYRYNPEFSPLSDQGERLWDSLVDVRNYSKGSGLIGWMTPGILVEGKLSGKRKDAPQFRETGVAPYLERMWARLNTTNILLVDVHALSEGQAAQTTDGLHYDLPVMLAAAQLTINSLVAGKNKGSEAGLKSTGNDGPATAGQLMMLIIWIAASLAWLAAVAMDKLPRVLMKRIGSPDTPAGSDEAALEEGAAPRADTPTEGAVTAALGAHRASPPTAKPMISNEHREMLASARPWLGAIALLGVIMMYCWITDGTSDKFWPSHERTYSRDFFFFLMATFFLMSYLTLRPAEKKATAENAPVLNRDQTEEWKGWMQVAFVLYHYFKASETYNAIRIYIAAYVWMTGFGNFSFFYVKKDFSMSRLSKMLFRLNFFVWVACTVLQREYMLYYVCALHTFAFLMVYLTCWVKHEHNENWKFLVSKLLGIFFVMTLLFEIPGVFDVVFTPLEFLLKYDGKGLYEWRFRATLDHYIWIFGMACAYYFPNYDAALLKLDSLYATNPRKMHLIKGVIGAVSMGVFLLWVFGVFFKVKHDYNPCHPYTSFIPVAVYMILRNLWCLPRNYYLGLMSSLGKTTLETYIMQHHIWLQNDAKKVTDYIPGYPFLNFFLASLIYLYVSWLVFRVTNILSDALIPRGLDDAKPLAIRLGKIGGVFIGVYVVCFSIKVLA